MEVDAEEGDLVEAVVAHDLPLAAFYVVRGHVLDSHRLVLAAAVRALTIRVVTRGTVGFQLVDTPGPLAEGLDLVHLGRLDSHHARRASLVAADVGRCRASVVAADEFGTHQAHARDCAGQPLYARALRRVLQEIRADRL